MKIAVLDDWAGRALDVADWGALEADITVFREPIASDEQASVLQPFEVLCLMRERTPLPAALINALPALRLVVTTGARNLAIDVGAAQARGVTVCGTQSRKTTTAEFTLTLMLAQSRALPANMASVAAGSFQVALGRDMADLRIGIVGLGQIGSQVARLAQAFGATVAAWSPNLTLERAAECGVAHAPTLNALAAQSDILSVHMVLSDRSAGLIDRSTFAALPQNALFVNTSRAGLVDREALFGWLQSNPAASAAIDVFEDEPIPSTDPWREVLVRLGSRLLLSPHLGYVSEATWGLFYRQTVEAIAAYQAGKPIRVLTA